MLSSSWSAYELNRSCLHDQSSELFQGEIIIKGSQEKAESWHIKIAIAEASSCLIERQNVFCIVICQQITVSDIKPEMSSFREDLLHLSIDSFYNRFFLLSCHPYRLLLDSFFHLLSIFSLFANCHLVSSQYQSFNILLQMSFVESDNLLHLAGRDTQINQLVTNGGILVVNDEPVAKAIEHNFVKVFALDLPITNHTGCQNIVLRFWNVHRTWIVIGMVGPSLLIIHHVLFLGPPGPVFIGFNHCVHVSLRPTQIPSFFSFRFYTLLFSIEKLCFCLRFGDSKAADSLRIIFDFLHSRLESLWSGGSSLRSNPSNSARCKSSPITIFL